MNDRASLLPGNASDVERSIEGALVDALGIALPIVANTRAEVAAEDHLPFLAWARSVDFWDSEWDLSTKRAAIAAAVKIHRHKGSVASVREALAAYGYGNAEIIEAQTAPRLDAGQSLDEGYRLHGLTHWATYAVLVNVPLRQQDADNLAAILAGVAPARCRLERIEARVNIALDEGYSLDEGWALDTIFNFEVT